MRATRLPSEFFNSLLEAAGFISRVEHYGPEDLPDAVMAITGFCDVQGDRLEAQLIAWGPNEEAWPFKYQITDLDPAQPQAWRELDRLIRSTFRTRSNRFLRIAAFGIDTGGHHGAEVHAFCRRRRGQRVFACQGISGKRPIWPVRSTRSKSNDPLFLIGVDSAKDALYGRLRIAEPGPGYIHFPAEDGFGPEYFEQLTSERRETRRRMGQSYAVWVLPPGKRNEVLDTIVGALAVRRSLPRRMEAGLEYNTASEAEPVTVEPSRADAPAREPGPAPAPPVPVRRDDPFRIHTRKPQGGGFLGRHRGCLSRN